ncbi:MAG: hypothetical protein J6S67_14555 [Methanobrevibacter sp.]|nr:hypothetical protein [Methanobrevibacter sp.]
MSKQSRKQGVKKSDRTVEWCKLIIEDLKKGDRSSKELEKKYGIRKNSFPSLLLQLTYEAPIYDYKVGKVLYLGLIK